MEEQLESTQDLLIEMIVYQMDIRNADVDRYIDSNGTQRYIVNNLLELVYEPQRKVNKFRLFFHKKELLPCSKAIEAKIKDIFRAVSISKYFTEPGYDD